MAWMRSGVRVPLPPLPTMSPEENPWGFFVSVPKAQVGVWMMRFSRTLEVARLWAKAP